ncbi:MAG: FMN-binding protein [Patescibacteria group bacterium]
MNANTPKIAGVLIISAVLIIGVYLAATQLGDDTDTASTATTSSQSVSDNNTASETSELSDSAPQTTVEYADGTYSVAAPYTSPGGAESIEVDVTVSDSQITAVSVEGEAGTPTSEQIQAGFIDAIADAVIGQEIGNAEINKLAGASLTTAAFNNALEDIRADAIVDQS